MAILTGSKSNASTSAFGELRPNASLGLLRFDFVPRPIDWIGRKGRPYQHFPYPLLYLPNFSGPANYMLTRHIQDLTFEVQYIGETDNLWRRIFEDVHEKRRLAIANGADIVHVCTIARTEAERREIEEDLVWELEPPLNDRTTTVKIVKAILAS